VSLWATTTAVDRGLLRFEGMPPRSSRKGQGGAGAALVVLAAIVGCQSHEEPGRDDGTGGAGGVESATGGVEGSGGKGGGRGQGGAGGSGQIGDGGSPGSGGTPSAGDGGSAGDPSPPDSGSTAERDGAAEDTNHARADAPVILDGSAADAPRADTRAPDAPVATGGEPARLAGMTKAHNDARATIPVPALLWDDGLAATAQAYAEKCVFQHSGHAGLGENLAAYYPPGHKAADAVKDWVDEKAAYDYASNSCSAVCGHYTQVVWKSSTRLGCGVATCTQNSPFGPKFPGAWENWVCNYTPPGNYVGQRPY
jgi:pathogenesis-related protein 1